MLYGTYFGGYDWDFIDDLAVDSRGRAFVGVTTETPHPYYPLVREIPDGHMAAAVTAFNADGSLRYSTRLPGAEDNTFDSFGAIAVDRRGDVVAAGSGAETFVIKLIQPR